MKLINQTQVDTGLLRSIIRFVKPSGVANFEFYLRYHDRHSPFRGRATPYSCGRQVVKLYLKRGYAYPRKGGEHPGGAYLPTPWLANEIEALVFLAAHELRHLWQANVPTGWRVWGSRGQYSERDADAYAIRMLRAWRRREAPPEEAYPGCWIPQTAKGRVYSGHHN